MKKLNFIVFFLYSFCSYSQTCDYTVERFGVRSEKKIFLGIENDFQGKPDSLFVDIYFPVGITEAKRPLVMWVFGGGFIAGKREDFAAVCESCAKRGFVAATIDYRIGFNGTSILPFDSAEVIRAGFRGAQDGKCALRYLKSRHVEDSIDLDRVWVGGGSAGSIVALATAFYNKDSEKPLEAGNIAAANGNPRNDLGSIQGERFLNGYDTKVQGVFNIFGAVLNLNIIDQSDNIAVFSYHQTEDPVVPCGHRKAYWAYPVVNDFYPYANGSCEIDPYLQKLGLNPAYHNAWIYPGNQHAVHNETAVINFMLTNANPILCGTVATNDVVQKELDGVVLYPNPVTDRIFLKDAVNGMKYTLQDLNGLVLESAEFAGSSCISTDKLNSGMYLLTLSKAQFRRVVKFIKI